MEFSCPFGTAEKLLREKEYPSEPDKEIEVDGKVMVLSGLRVFLPEFSVTVHEGIFCDRVDGKLQPDYFVTAIVDRNTGTLLMMRSVILQSVCFIGRRKSLHLP